MPILLSVLLLPLIVLFVSVWVPFKVATVESMAIVTPDDPLKLPPDKPVPIVNVPVVDAVMVPESPRATVTPLNVTELKLSDAFGMAVKLFNAPDMVLPVKVVGISALTKARKEVGADPPEVGPA